MKVLHTMLHLAVRALGPGRLRLELVKFQHGMH